jgi:hypothetical protein
MRSIAGAGNVGEAGVGTSEATDLASRTPSPRKGAKQLPCVTRRFSVCHIAFNPLIHIILLIYNLKHILPNAPKAHYLYFFKLSENSSPYGDGGLPQAAEKNKNA